MYDVIIIGGGPAAISAGIYAARLKLNTLVVAKNFGGQVAKKAVGIENYPGFPSISGPDLTQKMIDHLKEQEIKIEEDEAVKIDKENNIFLVSAKSENKYQAKAVIIASGADPRPLEVPGEKEFIGKGVSYCAVCDGPVFSGKDVAVIGGGNAGFESAIFLSGHASKIYILEYGEEVKADLTNQDMVNKIKNAEIITNASIKRIEGDDFVNAIVYEDKKTSQEKKLAVQGVFVEIGQQPATSFAKGLVDFNENDEIIVEPETCQTKTPGLYAAGDANAGPYKQIVTAAGEGAKAALAAFHFLKKNAKNWD